MTELECLEHIKRLEKEKAAILKALERIDREIENLYKLIIQRKSGEIRKFKPKG